MAANTHINPADLGCESADNWLLPFTSTITIYFYLRFTEADSDFFVPRRVEDWADNIMLWSVVFRLSYVRCMSDHHNHSVVSLAVSATSGDIVSASHQGRSAPYL